jgi:uncharacterized RDD family membrane protein YckC
VEGSPRNPDERFAEWYVWAKREVATDPKVCLGAAQAALRAEEGGASEREARAAARRSTAGLGVGFVSEVPSRRRAYAEWYDWARREVGGGPEQQHSATSAAMASLDGGAAAAEAAARGRQAAADYSTAHSPSPNSSSSQAPSPSPFLDVPAHPTALPQLGITATAPRTAYGGFWRRAAAFLIDATLLAIGWVVGASIILFFVVISLQMGGQPITDANANGIVLALVLGGLVLCWLYFAGLEGSPWQGTVGKRVMRVAVTDEAGSRIGFGRASGRYFAKIISAIPVLAGFWLVPVLGHKQGIHDLIAGTLVMKRDQLALVKAPPPSPQPVPATASPAGEAQGARLSRR